MASELFDLDAAVERHLRVHGSLPRRLVEALVEERDRYKDALLDIREKGYDDGTRAGWIAGRALYGGEGDQRE